ncbi:hypothetical protein Tcan_10469 [Toxocara canis]|uniref:WAP domain-containing protein n=1 Tax=Toxocara canis TaxID=6265 RepID=A0A0B2V6F3_TOXCA|nr:hypothetical protein Tcan_10469 [Toxocara canis]
MLCTVALFVVFGAVISGDVESAVHEVTSTKDGATWCPVALVGTQCPSSSIFHYYKCCGTANKDCCFNLQFCVDDSVCGSLAVENMFETVTIFLVFVSVIQQVASIEDGDKRCPIGVIGPVKCPDSNPFYYYKCCGAAGMDCCFKLQDGDKRCPIGVIGPVKCPDSNPFYYYKCCGAAGMDCCFKLQTWLIILLVVVAVLSIASLIVALVRCLCCDR